MREVWITSAVRTAIGNFLGGLSSFSATELGGFVIEEAVKRSGLRKRWDDVITATCYPGLGQTARQAMITGLPAEPTVNKVGGSPDGLPAAQAIKAGDLGGCGEVWKHEPPLTTLRMPEQGTASGWKRGRDGCDGLWMR
jgi:acetyl-CoA C-acetyltransferase